MYFMKSKGVDFDAVIATVAFLLYHFPEASFITSYQERSSGRTIAPLLNHWKLTAREITTEEFDWRDRIMDQDGEPLSKLNPSFESIQLFEVRQHKHTDNEVL